MLVTFLKIGKILAIFNLSGNIPLFRDWFIIICKGSDSNGFSFFKRIVEISSNPALCLELRFIIISLTVLLLIGLNLNTVLTVVFKNDLKESSSFILIY